MITLLGSAGRCLRDTPVGSPSDVLSECLEACIAGTLAHYDGAHHPAHSQLVEPSNYVSIEQDLTLQTNA